MSNRTVYNGSYNHHYDNPGVLLCTVSSQAQSAILKFCVYEISLNPFNFNFVDIGYFVGIVTMCQKIKPPMKFPCNNFN